MEKPIREEVSFDSVIHKKDILRFSLFPYLTAESLEACLWVSKFLHYMSLEAFLTGSSKAARAYAEKWLRYHVGEESLRPSMRELLAVTNGTVIDASNEELDVSRLLRPTPKDSPALSALRLLAKFFLKNQFDQNLFNRLLLLSSDEEAGPDILRCLAPYLLSYEERLGLRDQLIDRCERFSNQRDPTSRDSIVGQSTALNLAGLISRLKEKDQVKNMESLYLLMLMACAENHRLLPAFLIPIKNKSAGEAYIKLLVNTYTNWKHSPSTRLQILDNHRRICELSPYLVHSIESSPTIILTFHHALPKHAYEARRNTLLVFFPESLLLLRDSYTKFNANYYNGDADHPTIFSDIALDWVISRKLWDPLGCTWDSYRATIDFVDYLESEMMRKAKHFFSLPNNETGIINTHEGIEVLTYIVSKLSPQEVATLISQLVSLLRLPEYPDRTSNLNMFKFIMLLQSRYNASYNAVGDRKKIIQKLVKHVTSYTPKAHTVFFQDKIPFVVDEAIEQLMALLSDTDSAVKIAACDTLVFFKHLLDPAQIESIIEALLSMVEQGTDIIIGQSLYALTNYIDVISNEKLSEIVCRCLDLRDEPNCAEAAQFFLCKVQSAKGQAFMLLGSLWRPAKNESLYPVGRQQLVYSIASQDTVECNAYLKKLSTQEANQSTLTELLKKGASLSQRICETGSMNHQAALIFLRALRENNIDRAKQLICHSNVFYEGNSFKADNFFILFNRLAQILASDVPATHLNKFLAFFKTSNAMDSRYSLRQVALSMINDLAQAPNIDNKLSVLERALTEPIFSEHFNKNIASHFGKTDAVIHIEKIIAEQKSQNSANNHRS